MLDKRSVAWRRKSTSSRFHAEAGYIAIVAHVTNMAFFEWAVLIKHTGRHKNEENHVRPRDRFALPGRLRQ